MNKSPKIMDTLERKQLTPEERQANVDRFIKRWKESKEESIREANAYSKTPEFKETLKRLKEKNAKRGVIIPGV
jgi:phosphoglycolate phosphatase-like HAD superfamily hydrolase